MPLPNCYTIKTGSLKSYFDALLKAEAPQRFSQKFMESLDFKSTNDRLFIGILKEMGFLNADGVPTERYFKFLDKENSKKIIAEGIKHAYADLFALDKDANMLSLDKVEGKLKSLYQGQKTAATIKNIAKTFIALVQCADFEALNNTPQSILEQNSKIDEQNEVADDKSEKIPQQSKTLMSYDSLQYHINIILPESREQAVYDAIFKSLKNHLR